MVTADRMEFRVVGGAGVDVQWLQRRVVPVSGPEWTQVVDMAAVRAVAAAMESAGADGFTAATLAAVCWGFDADGLPRGMKRADMVLAFAAAVGLVERPRSLPGLGVLRGTAFDVVYEVVVFRDRVRSLDEGGWALMGVADE